MQWPPRPGSRLERHEAERLGRGGLDDLPDVDVHPVAELRELVDERDVDRAEDVLEELRQLGCLGRRDRVHRVDRRRVERDGGGGRALVDPADDLRHGLRRPVLATRVDALGGEGEVEVLAGGEAAPALEDRLDLLPRRARVRRRLEHDEMALAKARGDLLRRRHEDAQIGLALAGQRRRERDEDRVGVAQLVVVGRRGDEAGLDERPQNLRRDVLDVALPGVELRDAIGVDVDEQHGGAGIGEGASERQADVARADDGDVALHRLGIVAASTCAILSDACPSPYRTGRFGGERRIRDGCRERFRIVVDEHVRADRHRVDPLRRGPDGDARHAVPVRLLLQAARVRHDHACLRCERGELEIAERLDEAHVRAEREAVFLQTSARARMDGEDDHLVDPIEAFDDASEARLLDVRLAVDRRDDVATRLVGHGKRRAGQRCEEPARVGHDVADDVDPAQHSFRFERSFRSVVGAEQEPGEAVGLDPVVLLRHREVAASQPGLDVRERDRRIRCGLRAGERRVRVAVDEHDVG